MNSCSDVITYPEKGFLGLCPTYVHTNNKSTTNHHTHTHTHNPLTKPVIIHRDQCVELTGSLWDIKASSSKGSVTLQSHQPLQRSPFPPSKALRWLTVIPCVLKRCCDEKKGGLWDNVMTLEYRGLGKQCCRINFNVELWFLSIQAKSNWVQLSWKITPFTVMVVLSLSKGLLSSLRRRSITRSAVEGKPSS